MKRCSLFLCSLTMGLFFLCPAMAAPLLLDNFNRDDNSDLGSNWTIRSGDFDILSNQANPTSNELNAGSWARATYNGATSNEIYVDIFYNSNTNPQFAGLILGYNDLDKHLLLKVQNNSNSYDTFDSCYIYYGSNLMGIGGLGFSFTEARLSASLVGNSVSLGIDTNFDYINEYTYAAKLSETQLDHLGRGIGISGFNGTKLDNFSMASVPEPATMLLLGSGLIGLAGFRRKVKKG